MVLMNLLAGQQWLCSEARAAAQSRSSGTGAVAMQHRVTERNSPCPRPGTAAVRRYTMSKVRSRSCALPEQP